MQPTKPKLKIVIRPSWSKHDQRELPDWFKQSQTGIIIHWGIYSVPAFHILPKTAKKKGLCNGSEWYWKRLRTPFLYKTDTRDYHHNTYGVNFDYTQFAQQFNPTNFDPNKWAKLFKDAGATYVVFTAKHHDGFCMWSTNVPTQYNNGYWDVGKIGPKRDIFGELATAVRQQGMKFGIYYSLYEWYNPLYNSDKRLNKKEGRIVSRNYVQQVVNPHLQELLDYEPEIIFFDGDWEQPPEYWRSIDILNMLYTSRNKDTIVVNDRLGDGTAGKHGDYFNIKDRFIPTDNEIPNKKWETVMTIGNSWGYNQMEKPFDFKSVAQVKELQSEIYRKGGNLLLNVGPDQYGNIRPEEQTVLLNLTK